MGVKPPILGLGWFLMGNNDLIFTAQKSGTDGTAYL
jgi:hypothetical protein